MDIRIGQTGRLCFPGCYCRVKPVDVVLDHIDLDKKVRVDWIKFLCEFNFSSTSKPFSNLN